MHGFANAAALACEGVALAGIAYLIVAIVRIWTFVSTPRAVPDTLPSISVLKPLYGDEPHLYENLRTFCTQAYPQYQVVFCVHEASDPAFAIAERLIAEFPHVDLSVAVKSDFTAANPKVENLAAGLARAKYDLLVIADSDVRVAPDCLRAIAAAFSDPKVGAASCLYRGNSQGDLPSALGALHINGHFAPSVLVAIATEQPRFCLGATMAVRRTVLQEIGGLATLGAHLGDDYMLGALTAERGHAVSIAPYVVTCMVSEADFSSNFHHQLRWARTIARQRPIGYACLFVTMPLPFALAGLLLSLASPLAIAVFVAMLIARYTLHVSARNALALCDRGGARVVPLGDLLEFAVWVCGFFGNAVNWRARKLRIGNAGQVR